jgi:archaemetzincin
MKREYTKPEILQAIYASLSNLEAVRTTLAALYGLPVLVLAPVAMPAYAHVAAGRRYRADITLEYLRDRLPADGFRILGLTADDVSTTRVDHPDWGVIGLASYEGRSCIVSTFRCGGAHTTARQRQDRLLKVAIHEVSHTLGLPHCTKPGCLMADAQGTARTVDRELDLCAACRAIADQAGCACLAGVRLPWMPAPSEPVPVVAPVALETPPVQLLGH